MLITSHNFEIERIYFQFSQMNKLNEDSFFFLVVGSVKA